MKRNWFGLFFGLLILLFSHVPTANAAPANSVELIAAAHLVTNIQLSPETPNIMKFNKDVTISFDYNTTLSEGVRIFARPYTGTSPTPNYSASGSPLYPVGSGSGSGTFTITSGAVTVTKIRFQIWNDAQTTKLFQTDIPVNYKFKGDSDIVHTISLSPRTPNIMNFGQNVSVSFNYDTTEVNGVRIFARPMTKGVVTPNYSACPSPIYPVGSGSGVCTFTITSGAVTVDAIRFQIWNDSQTKLLFQSTIPVSYQFKGSRTMVSGLNLAPLTPNILKFSQNVTVSFNYTTTKLGGVRIFARPFTGNSLTPNYAACPSPLYPTGSGSGSCTFTITKGAATVNKIRFQVWNAAQTSLLFETFIPVNYQFR